MGKMKKMVSLCLVLLSIGLILGNSVLVGAEDTAAWIESLKTNKKNYNLDENIKVTVIVRRGNDMLTVVMEGTLNLTVTDENDTVVFWENKNVSIPSGGGSNTLHFQFSLNETGKYVVSAELWIWGDSDYEETKINVGIKDDKKTSGFEVSLLFISILAMMFIFRRKTKLYQF